MAERARDEKAIFLAALEKATSQERNAFVEGACAGDPELLERVRELLESHDESVGPLDSPPAGVDATIDQPITEGSGSRIDRYKLLEQIGEGGFGVVFMAEQEEPVRRKVALKVIKPGMDTKEVIARFEAERQALAMMDHPNIARVLDADTTESGRPYFVMELVRGVPITEYCDQNKLTTRERLELFGSICRAVQHAHQKGIIHRDIKPSNVMVTMRDDTPVAKVIDFGVAKATNQRLTEKTLFTRYSQMIGTPLYMSPEQAQMNEWDVDTRSDIYSLGVLLYELLSGTTPFDKERMRHAAYDELLKIIREEEPPKPSMRISTLGDLATDVSAHRKSDPKKLSAVIRGELDWIVMKALEKDRTRRYETATGLANDIARYLNDEAITARPPSALYRFRKLARRNKAALATAAVVAAALLLGIVGTTWQAIRATDARDDAVQAQMEEAKQRVQAEKAKTAAEDAKTAAEDARAVAEDARRQEQAQREEAERQRERAEGNFALARSAVDEFLNQVTENELLTVPGLQPLRQELLSSAMEFYDDFTQDAENTSELQVELAAAHHRIAVIRGELGQAEESKASNAKSIELFEQLRDAGNESLEVRLGLAKAYFRSKRYDDTAALCQSILETDSKHAETRSLLANTYNSLACDDKNDKDMAAALKYHQQALLLREGLVQDFPDNPEYLAELGGTVNNLGVLLGRQGKNHKALEMFQRGVSYKAEAYRNAPQTILWGRWLGIGLRNVAVKQAAFGNQQEALQSFRRLVEIRRKLAFENPAVPSLKGDLYKAYLDLGNYQKQLGDTVAANRSLRAAQEILENTPRETPAELFELATVYGALATPDDGATEPTEAERDDQQRYTDLAMETLLKAAEGGYRNLKVLQSHKRLAALREREDFQQLVGRLEKEIRAEELAAKESDTDEQKLADRRQAVDVLRELIGSDSPEARHRATLAAALHSICEIQMGLGQYAEAEESLREAFETRQALLDEEPDNPQAALDVLAAEYSQGRLHWVQEGYATAHRCWQACLDRLLDLARTHRENQELQWEISILERKIFQHYGRCGLFPLVREYAARSVEFNRLWAVDVPNLPSEGEFSAAVLVGPHSTDLAREFLRKLAQSCQQAEREPYWEIIHLVRGIAAIGDSDLFSEQLLARAQNIFDERSDNPWVAVAMAVVNYQRGEYSKVQSILEQFRGHTAWPEIAFLDAAVAAEVGDRRVAEDRWSAAEERYRSICEKALSADVADNNSGIFNKHWWQFAYSQVTRRLACEAMSGEPAADPWQHLIQARGYRLIGETEKADAELAAASAAAPEDAEVRLARVRLLVEWDEIERAEADWQKAVDSAGDDPMPWIHRGRWYAERGEHEKADADFAKAASLTPNELNKFLEAGWWVVGPYPPNLDEFCPPEIDPDPSKPVYVIDPKTGLSDEPARWRHAATGDFGRVDLGPPFEGKGERSVYAVTYIYSPDERTAMLWVGGEKPVRVWLNGSPADRPARPASIHFAPKECVPVVLRPGRNTVMVKAVLPHFYASLGDCPFDRGCEFARFGLYKQAADALGQAFTPPRDRPGNLHWQFRQAMYALEAGDTEEYRTRATELLTRFQKSSNPAELAILTEVCSLSPEGINDPRRLVQFAEQWKQHLNETARRNALTMALVYYRAGRWQDAVEFAPKEHGHNWPILAMAYHQLQQPADAHYWLEKSKSRFEAWLGDFHGKTPLEEFYILYREACELIHGSATDVEQAFEASQRERLQLWQGRDPATAAFDDAVRIAPDQPQVYLARGRRLAELERWDEAEADFNRAVEVAPDDPDVLVERATFFADRGMPDRAASDLNAALQLAESAGNTACLNVGLQAALRPVVFDRLVALRSDDSAIRWLWVARMFLHTYEAESEDAHAAAQLEQFGFQPLRASVALLRGDRRGFELNRDSRLPNWDADTTARLLYLTPTEEPLTSELLAAATRAAKRSGREWLLGVAEFRAGRFQDAIGHLEGYATRGSWRGFVLPVLAMACHGLGDQEHARRWLAKSDLWMDWHQRRPSIDVRRVFWSGSLNYLYWLDAAVFHREAKQLIEGTSDAGQGKPQVDQGPTPKPAPVAKPEPKDAKAITSKPPAPEATSNAKPKEKQE